MKKNRKSIIRLILFMALLAISYKAISQPKPFEFFVRVGNDTNMLIKGAYPDRGDANVYGMHNKYGFGFEWEHVRIGMDVESFSAIGFTKWTYMYADYKVASGIRNITLFGGLEMSQIKIHHPDFNGSDPNNYREYTINPLLFGANGEIVFRKQDSHFALGLQGNIHQAEDELKPYKKFRKQVFVNLYFYF